MPIECLFSYNSLNPKNKLGGRLKSQEDNHREERRNISNWKTIYPGCIMFDPIVFFQDEGKFPKFKANFNILRMGDCLSDFGSTMIPKWGIEKDTKKIFFYSFDMSLFNIFAIWKRETMKRKTFSDFRINIAEAIIKNVEYPYKDEKIADSSIISQKN
ncbi:hypothetical protein A3Q56_03281 [Intoshia linei]|uniref:Uncharacterized protein n=1 Tax=Intoshia linei TaxID=1819745 RepID=A0A177B5X3_9BILA|nr:hypothetical protein A3Q56_03281 [Intoshia linei]